MITIFYPSGFLTIRSPEIGDTRRLQTNVVNRTSIAGEPKTCDYWPDVQVRTFTIRALTAAQKTGFKQMLEASAGQQITISDYNDELWLGVIISDPEDIVTIRDNCWYDVSFEFLGSFIGVASLLQNDVNAQVYNDSNDTVKVI